MRQRQSRLGCKKLYNQIKPELVERGIKIGRDRVIKLLGEHGMHIEKRRKYRRTTYSNHSYAVAPNRIKKLKVNKANQVFVSDITYISLKNGFCYLYLVTDLYSRKIVGYNLRKDLKHEGAIKALGMAIDNISDTERIIHHSDRGCQYCCHSFLDFLRENRMVSSMTDESHCYQNAVAERVNGILKDEFYLDISFKSFSDALKATASAIKIYNRERIHWSLALKTPNDVYFQEKTKLAA